MNEEGAKHGDSITASEKADGQQDCSWLNQEEHCAQGKSICIFDNLLLVDVFAILNYLGDFRVMHITIFTTFTVCPLFQELSNFILYFFIDRWKVQTMDSKSYLEGR